MKRKMAVLAVVCALSAVVWYVSPGRAEAQTGATDAVMMVGNRCNNVALTWNSGTPTATVAAAITPPSAVLAIWRFNGQTQTWVGYSPAAPTPSFSDLLTVNRLDAVWICLTENAVLTRPRI